MNEPIFCVKLKKLSQPLESAPFPGKLGLKIHQNVCSEAWTLWIAHQTMLINEYRLSLIDPKSREFILGEMEKYFFGDGSAKPGGFVPQE